MQRRERVMQAIDFKATDRIPKDLGGMLSTGISCFAYPKLVDALRLPPRLPKIHDQFQMLALPDKDVLDALDCDVVTIHWDITNAFDQPKKWHPYDFGGRLPAFVRNPSDFSLLDDGTVIQPAAAARMPLASHVFDTEHGGQSIDFIDGAPLPLMDLDRFREDTQTRIPSGDYLESIVSLCRQARESTDRAIMYNGPGCIDIGIGSHGGIGVFPVICTLHPDYVLEYHEILTNHYIGLLQHILPQIRDNIDIIMLCADDWGTQSSTIASPKVYRNLFKPFIRRINDTVHQIAPNVRTFLHSCGAVYPLIDDFIESGYDILNPVQWTAGGHSYQEWKDKCRGRIALWGGGVNSQYTLPFGTVTDVRQEVYEISRYFQENSGYIFNPIHNILAETTPEKIIAMYRSANL